MYDDNTKVKGGRAEIEAIRFFVAHGYTVSLPFGENAPYDLIIESPALALYRVQVRWSTWQGDRLPVRLRVISKNYSRAIDQSRIDAFAVWDGETLYVIPTLETKVLACELSLRRVPALNNQKAGIRLAETFREAVRFVP